MSEEINYKQTVSMLDAENKQLKTRLSRYGDAPKCQNCLSPLVPCEKGEEGAIRQDGDDIMSRGFMRCESCANEKVNFELMTKNDQLEDEIKKMRKNNYFDMSVDQIEKALAEASLDIDTQVMKLKTTIAGLLLRLKAKAEG